MKMLRLLINSLILLCLILPLQAQQRPGSLRGVIKDAKTGEGIPFVNIVIKLPSEGIIAGGASDIDGNYNINPIDGGAYTVEVSAVGYATVKLLNIQIAPNNATCKDFRLVETTETLDEVIITSETPLIDKSRSSKSYSAESITKMACRGIGSDGGAFAPGLSTDYYGAVVRGARADGSIYYVDGVKINSEFKISRSVTPPKAIITGGLPGQYGDNPSILNDNVDFISPTKIKFSKIAPDGFEADVKSSTLTAGEINDFAKWILWEDLTEVALEEHKTHWAINPATRYSVQLTFKGETPVINAETRLLDKTGRVLWTSRTDNTGKSEMWANVFGEKDEPSRIAVTYKGINYEIKKPKEFNAGINLLELNGNCELPSAIDISFVVDATGSMGDEIAYLKAELKDVMLRVKSTLPNQDLRLSSVFYRDKGDAYVTQKSDFSGSIEKTIDFIKNQSAGGGGDYPEAVIEALDVAINELSWRENTITRIIFLVLDAPPHHSKEQLTQIHDLLKQCAKNGIRIIPIASSGINKSTEYLLRTMALTTNGTYTFLTDDSGVGNPHIAPTTDSYEVELLNDLMVRIIHQFSFVPLCKPQVNEVTKRDSADSDSLTKLAEDDELEKADDFGWDVYPNPSNGLIKVELSKKVDVLYVTDLHGKILSKWEMDFGRKAVLDLSGYPSGTYFIRFQWKDRWLTEQIILAH